MREDSLILVEQGVNDENVLAVVAAIQAFETSIIAKNNEWNAKHYDNRVVKSYIDIACPSRYVDLFRKTINTARNIWGGNIITYPADANYSFVCYLSIDRALDLAKGTDKPLALALGIVLGCESSTLANVSNLCQEYTSRYKLLLDFKLTLDSNVVDAIYAVNKLAWDAHRIYGSTTNKSTLAERIQTVFDSDIVVGYSSFETYLACCLQKPVVEIQTNPLLYKWNNQNYKCISDTSRLQELVPKGIAQCLSLVTKR